MTFSSINFIGFSSLSREAERFQFFSVHCRVLVADRGSTVRALLTLLGRHYGNRADAWQGGGK